MTTQYKQCPSLLNRPCVPRVQAQQIHFYTAVIAPVLEYATPVWHHLLTKSQTDQIEATGIQTRALNNGTYTACLNYTNTLVSFLTHEPHRQWQF